MNTSAHVDPQKSGHEVWEEFSHSFTPAVREVVEFAKKIPGFRDLSQPDQVSLLKAGTFEVCCVSIISCCGSRIRHHASCTRAHIAAFSYSAGVGGSLRLSL